MSTEIQAFSPEQVDLIRRQIAPGISQDELAIFLGVCNRTGLDPFSRQIYALPRQAKNPQTGAYEQRMSIQTSIDGFRLIADRVCRARGWMRGNLPTEWTADGEKWVTAWLPDTPPAAARYTVVVSEGGKTMQLSAVARTKSYVQTYRDGKPSGLWAKMPEVMIAKCAEALALRQMFPAELSGLYTADEMQQAAAPAEAEINPPPRVDDAPPRVPAQPAATVTRPSVEDKAAHLGISPEGFLWIQAMPPELKAKIRAAKLTPSQTLTAFRYGQPNQMTVQEMHEYFGDIPNG